MAERLMSKVVSARGREWVVLPQSAGEVLRLRPVGSGEDNL